MRTEDNIITGTVFTKVSERDDDLKKLLTEYFAQLGCTECHIDRQDNSSFDVIFLSKKSALKSIVKIYDQLGKANFLTIGSKTTMAFDNRAYSIKHAMLLHVEGEGNVGLTLLRKVLENLFSTFCSTHDSNSDFQHVLLPRNHSSNFMLFLNQGRAKQLF